MYERVVLIQVQRVSLVSRLLEVLETSRQERLV